MGRCGCECTYVCPCARTYVVVRWLKLRTFLACAFVPRHPSPFVGLGATLPFSLPDQVFPGVSLAMSHNESEIVADIARWLMPSAEMAQWFMPSLTQHPKRIAIGKGGQSLDIKWFPDVHYRACKGGKGKSCSCCTAKTAMNDAACKLCVTAWRMSTVCRYWRDAVHANGLAKRRWRDTWTKVHWHSKFAYRWRDYGNTRSTSFNYHVLGNEPQVDHQPHNDSTPLAIADSSALQTEPQPHGGYKPQDWSLYWLAPVTEQGYSPAVLYWKETPAQSSDDD